MRQFFSKSAKLLLAISCSVSCLFTQSMTTTFAKNTENIETIDDMDERFVYSAGEANNGGWTGSDGATPDKSEHWSNTSGATITITFYGTKLELYGKKAPNHKMFSVAIDHNEATKHDAYAQQPTDNNALLYESEALTAGEHTAVLTVLEEKNENAKDAIGMNIAYAKTYA